MSFDTLKEAILKEARTEAEQVSGELMSRVKAEEERITQKAREVEEAIIREAESEADRQAKLKRQEAELGGRAGVLDAKEQELAATKQAFREALLKQEESATKHMLETLLNLVGAKEGTIVPGDAHRDILKTLAKTFTIAEESIPGDGGFIFRNQDTEINVTVSHLVDQLFQKHRAVLAKRLFS